MNREFSAETRPRMSSGVRIWTRVERTTTLMLSQEPRKKSIAIESQKCRESPKMIVTVPKPATANSNVLQAFRNGPRCACSSAIVKAPIDGAVINHPSPRGPTRKMSFA